MRLSDRFDFAVHPHCIAQNTSLWSDDRRDESIPKGISFSPDGILALTTVDTNKYQLFQLPSHSFTTDADLTTTSPDIPFYGKIIKESGTIYDYTWYPAMNMYNNPLSACFLSVSHRVPVHLWDALSGTLRCSYIGHNEQDELADMYSCAWNTHSNKILVGGESQVFVFDAMREGRELELRKKCPSRRAGKHGQGQRGIFGAIALTVTPSRYVFSQLEANTSHSIFFLACSMYAVGSYMGSLCLYANDSGELISRFHDDGKGVRVGYSAEYTLESRRQHLKRHIEDAYNCTSSSTNPAPALHSATLITAASASTSVSIAKDESITTAGRTGPNQIAKGNGISESTSSRRGTKRIARARNSLASFASFVVSTGALASPPGSLSNITGATIQVAHKAHHPRKKATTGVTRVRFSPCGNYVYAGYREFNEILSWDIRGDPRKVVSRFERCSPDQQRIDFELVHRYVPCESTTEDGESESLEPDFLLGTGSKDGRFLIYSTKEPALLKEVSSLDRVGTTNDTRPASFDAVGHVDAATYIAEHHGNPPTDRTIHNAVNAVSFNPHGRLIMAALGERRIPMPVDENDSESEAEERGSEVDTESPTFAHAEQSSSSGAQVVSNTIGKLQEPLIEDGIYLFRF